MMSQQWAGRIELMTRVMCLALGLVLLFTGVYKALDLGEFAKAIESHGLLPHRFIMAASVGITGIELIVGVFGVAAACFQFRSTAALLMIGAVFAAFGAYGMLLHVFPPPKPAACGCGFGNAPVESWMLVGIRNALVGAVCTIAWRCHERAKIHYAPGVQPA